MKNRRGEIATILTIGTLVVIGATAIFSSLGLNKQRSTSTRAACAANTCAGSGTTCLPIGTVSSGLTCCAAHLGQVDHTWATWNTSCKAAVNTPIPTMTVAPTQVGCKTPPMICTDPIGTQGACCKGYVCYGAGPGFPSRCTAPAGTGTPIPTVTPGANSCSKGGQPTIGTKGYDKETCESICGAQNGTYVGPNQQWNEAGQRGCCCAVGNSNPNAVCPQLGLGYACCVLDNRCDGGTNRYQWYGCTGQVCSATKIVTQGGPGHLVDCPYGVNKSNPTSCEGQNIPPPAGCTDNGSYGLLGGCKEKCTTAGYECKAADGDAAGEKRFCCPTTPTIDPNAPSERDAPCVAAYGATSYCSTNHACNGDDEYAPDMGSVTCTNPTSGISDQRCCKPKGSSTPKCVKHGCKDMSPSFSTLKSYYQKGDIYYTSSACTDASAYANLEAVTLYCSEGVTAPFDNDCREALQDPQAQCVLNPIGFIVGGNYEKTDIKCGPFKLRYCYKKKEGMDYIMRHCSSIDPSYSSTLLIYEKDGKYYSKKGTVYTEVTQNELAVYCSQGMFSIYDNKCKQTLQDATAECPLTSLPNGGQGYEVTTTKCGPSILGRYCYIKTKPTDVTAQGSLNGGKKEAPKTGEPVYTVPTDVVGECLPENTYVDGSGTYCLTFDTQGNPILTPFTPPNP